jgi:hypothetical protein
VVGKALELRHEGTQMNSTLRRLDAEGGFNRLRKSQRIGDRAVARYATCEARRAVESGAAQQ